MTKKIGILTSGGDCAGLNAAIRAVIHHADSLGWEVYGIREGTGGLMERPVKAERLTMNQAGSTTMLRMGGTILGAINSGNPFAFPMPDGSLKDRTDDILEGYKMLGLDAVVCVGGDGSFGILKKIGERGDMKMVGIPKTIDNDVGLTETSIGYDTAVQVAAEALGRLQPTAASHNRVMILEVMGRDAGHIALAAGIAGGADVIIIPEIPYKIDNIAKKIKAIKASGRNHALIIVAEAVKTETGEPVMFKFSDGQVRYGGIGQYLAARISETTGAECRVTNLGHIQRGGVPSHHDAILASAFGVHAVELIKQGKFGRMVAWQNRKVVDVSIEDAIGSYQVVEPEGSMVTTARGLGICLGDK